MPKFISSAPPDRNEPFSHENFGQLNTYVSYWKENEMQPGDNPPVGLLLCTKKGKKMVEYAKADSVPKSVSE